jgi:hypothetical protein
MFGENVSMKQCEYCGRENEEDALHCTECGSHFANESTQDPAPPGWNPHSPLGLAVTSGLGSFLIGTAAVFLAGRVMVELFQFAQPPDPDDPVIGIRIFFFPYTRLLLAAVVVAFTLWICFRRCEKSSHALIAATVTSILFACVTFGPMFVEELFVVWWLFPLAFLGFGPGSALGFYAGAAFQIAAGMWLLVAGGRGKGKA